MLSQIKEVKSPIKALINTPKENRPKKTRAAELVDLCRCRPFRAVSPCISNIFVVLFLATLFYIFGSFVSHDTAG